MTPNDFAEKIKSVCARDTSAHPDEWTADNPFLGHCTIVSLLAQDIFGGEILRLSLVDVPGFEEIKWHSWNRFPDGTERDFTESQFAMPLSVGVRNNAIVKSREELFSYPGIKERYVMLKSRIKGIIINN